MKREQYKYALIVEGDEAHGYTAALDEIASPLRGYGRSPLEAVHSLCDVLQEWPISGADRWLTTEDGVRMARQFVPGFEPGKSGGRA